MMEALLARFAVPKRKSPMYCSFCGKSDKHVAKLLAGPAVYICGGCVDICNRILAGKPAPSFADLDAQSDEQILGALVPSLAAVEDARALLQRQIDALRKRDVSWQRIGDVLGMSRQAAWERFG